MALYAIQITNALPSKMVLNLYCRVNDVICEEIKKIKRDSCRTFAFYTESTHNWAFSWLTLVLFSL